VIGEPFPRQATARRTSHREPHPCQVTGRPVVVGKGPLGNVSVQVDLIDVDLGALERSLELAPEILHRVGVNVARDVLAGVVDGLVGEVPIKSLVGPGLVRVDGRAMLHPTTDVSLESQGVQVAFDDFGLDDATALWV